MIKRHGRTEHYHRAVEVNGVFYLTGMTAADKTAPMRGQAEQVLAKLDTRLAAIGSDKTKVVHATIYLTDMSLKDEVNEVWTSWFDPEHLPSRATVGVAALGKGVLIELVVTATR